MTPIVLDKSYLHAGSLSKLEALANRYNFLMTPSLLYEITRGSPGRRSGFFKKMQPTAQRYIIVEDISSALRYEMREQLPYGKPSIHARIVDYRNHDRLIDKTYNLDPPLELAIKQRRDVSREQAVDILNFAKSNENKYREIIGKHNQVKNVEAFEHEIANNRSRVFEIFRQMKIDHDKVGGSSKPSLHAFNESWMTYRWIQALDLFALDIIFRHNDIGSILDIEQRRKTLPDDEIKNYPEIASNEKIMERIEHDGEDFIYFVLALAEGAFAVNEKKLIRWFRLLRPLGIIESNN